jgi:uncharacterized NAD(P)/FAD-binding protein YdhS
MRWINEKQGETAPPVIAIIGGGFTGTAIALHLARKASPAARIEIFEPRATLGMGLAYSTQHPAHRVNATAQRMSPWPDAPDHFYRWLLAFGACADDPQATLPDGRLFPRRGVFGAYMAAQAQPYLASGEINHIRSAATALSWRAGRWAIETEASSFPADIVVLATGHTPPAVPQLSAAVLAHPRFIPDPWRPGALATISAHDRVLIVGTGLTMADTVAMLDQAGHGGSIHAISRRGQLPHPHAEHVWPPYGTFNEPPCLTASALFQQVRETVGHARADGMPWQSVFDALRSQATAIWTAFPEQERRRFLRHARPYWETRRHRLPPPTGAVLERWRKGGTLTIEAALLEAISVRTPKLQATFKPVGRDAVEASFDAVILTTGPGKLAATQDRFVRQLLRDGIVRPDATGQGFVCDGNAQPLGAAGPWPQLFVAGPLTRGSLGDVTGVPEIARQAEGIAKSIAREINARKKVAAFFQGSRPVIFVDRQGSSRDPCPTSTRIP